MAELEKKSAKLLRECWCVVGSSLVAGWAMDASGVYVEGVVLLSSAH